MPRKKPDLDQPRRQLLLEALSYVLPEAQAQQAVKSLWGSLGGFSALMTAPQDELARLPGMNQDAARFLYLAMDLARACMEEQAGALKRVMDSASAVELFRPKFLGRKTEAVCLMLLDSRRRLLYNDILTEGAVGAVPVYIRKLVRLCIEYDASVAILAHNHPSGSALPSQGDMMVTKQVEMALEGIDASLRDHIILTEDGGSFSFMDSGMLGEMAGELRAGRREALDAVRERWAEMDFESGLSDS